MADSSQSWQVPAEASQLAGIRERVRRFAHRAGITPADTEAAVLAASEAAGNVILHAYPGRGEPGPVRMEMSVTGTSLTLSVGDDGVGWRGRSDSPGAGLGLGIIDRLTAERSMTAGRDGGTHLMMRFALTKARSGAVNADAPQAAEGL
jgi:anti-sigma regulatory factor (Ser/Thr protein kinase)